MSLEIDESLKIARTVYADRGFQNRIGYGNKPAVIIVDLAKAWTLNDSPFSCENMETVISNVCRILDIARAKAVPVFYTTTAYEPSMKDAGLWPKKIPALKTLKLGHELCEIDDRLKRREDEVIIVKKMASAFDGTDLYTRLRTLDIDTVLVTGVTASSCIRKTVEDAISLGFRPIIPEGSVSDRIPEAVKWNLFDLDAKFGDVEPLEEVIRYLKGL